MAPAALNAVCHPGAIVRPEGNQWPIRIRKHPDGSILPDQDGNVSLTCGRSFEDILGIRQ